jgi:HAMP domain-containing protein
MMTDALGAAGLIAGIVSVFAIWRQQSVHTRDNTRLREETDRRHHECLAQICQVREEMEASETNAQSSLELLRDGRLGMPARARALQMLRSGMAAETAATELGLARNEVQLLAKVAALLAPRN